MVWSAMGSRTGAEFRRARSSSRSTANLLIRLHPRVFADVLLRNAGHILNIFSLLRSRPTDASASCRRRADSLRDAAKADGVPSPLARASEKPVSHSNIGGRETCDF